MIGGLAAAALLLGACGDDEKKTPTASIDLNPSSTVATTDVPDSTATTAKSQPSTVGDVAELIAAAGLGCSDLKASTPTAAAGYPAQKEFANCTVSGRKASIAIYSKEGDAEAALKLTGEQLCKQIGKTAVEKVGIAYGPLYTVGTDNSDPAIAADIAKATGGQVKRFTCA